MADIKYEIREELGNISEKAGQKKSILFHGTVQRQNMISETGHRSMKKWAKELHSQKKKFRNYTKFSPKLFLMKDNAICCKRAFNVGHGCYLFK